MERRLEDRIRDLCAKAVSTPESPELDQILADLKRALEEHINRIRARALFPQAKERRSPI